MSEQIIQGRYALIDQVGDTRGIGSWVAFDRVLRSDVVVKVLPPEAVSSPVARERFEQRAAAVAGLAHSNLARVRESGVDPERGAFIVCDRLHGEDLGRRVARLGRVAPYVLGPLLAQCVRALLAAHEQGVAHGAVRPDHVFLARGEGGEVVRLVGFAMTGDGAFDPAADLRALAATALYALTGDSDEAATTGDEALDAFFARALGRAGEAGFSTASEMGAALAALNIGTRARRPNKVLVVDDEADVEMLIKQRFRRQIRKGEYEFLFARDGAEALEKLAAHQDTDAVLSDINMPEMDGLTFLTRAREMLAYLKVVMVSAYGDLGNIRAAMNRGAFDFVTKPIDFGDLEVTLQKAIREVSVVRDALQRQADAERAKSNLARYFPPNLVDLLSAGAMPFGAGQRIKATALFADMVSFSTMAETMAPEEVLSLLREFHGFMEAEVFRYGGTLEKYIGDALLAVFGMPAPGARDATNAVACAHAMLRAIDGWNRARTARGLHPIRIGIGLHHGPVVVGDIGSDRNVAVVVLGDTINVASRLQSLTRDLDSSIVLTQEVVDAVRGEVGADAESVLRDLVDQGEVKLRGRATPMRVSKLPNARASTVPEAVGESLIARNSVTGAS